MSSPLSQPFTLPCGVVFPGRIIKAAMTEALADDWSNATEGSCNLYSTWSKNHNAGHVLITGNVQVDRRYMERPGNIAIEIECVDKEARMTALKRLAEAAQQDGTLCMVQLSHAGRQSSVMINKEALAPSAIKPQAPMELPEPRAMTQADIDDVVARFANAALVCKEAGFLGGIELHGAHGYLLSQFLSPHANTRTDEYGGSLENRSRLLLQVYRACRAAVGPQYPIAVKLNSSDFQKGGFSNEDAVEVAKMLEREGVDLLELSGGSYENGAMTYGPGGFQAKMRGETTAAREGYFLEFTAKIRAELKTLPVMVTGGFRTKARMERALVEDKDCDFIGVARPVCAAPDCVARMLCGETDSLPSFEQGLSTHWSLRWLDWFATGKMVYGLVGQAWPMINMHRFANGQEEPNTELNPTMLYEFMQLRSRKDAAAYSMRGMDGIVGTHLNTTP